MCKSIAINGDKTNCYTRVCTFAAIHEFTLVCLDIQFILSSSSLPFATNIARYPFFALCSGKKSHVGSARSGTTMLREIEPREQ